ncbi:MAG: hypothetical protein IT479_06210, partial [Xanthomonadales bacterium]|nr:hypothetical protein [Xanthomonadales bacterium]
MLARELGEAQARTLAFVDPTVSNRMLCLSVLATHRSVLRTLLERDHGAFQIIAATVSAVVVACAPLPGLAALFGFASPKLRQALEVRSRRLFEAVAENAVEGDLPDAASVG